MAVYRYPKEINVEKTLPVLKRKVVSKKVGKFEHLVVRVAMGKGCE